jgi:hypothetical protein
MVCVRVTIPPRKAACFKVPREPTRYAATMVLPCPGVSACAAPKANAMPIATAIIHGVSACWCSNRVRGSVCGVPACNRPKSKIMPLAFYRPCAVTKPGKAANAPWAVPRGTQMPSRTPAYWTPHR